MNTATQTTARSRSKTKPHGKGVFVDFDLGPTRRAILYWDPEPVADEG